MNENAQKITDHVRGNLTALQYFILYGVLFKKSVSDWYNALCRMFGNDSMEYTDFEFWFMRFSNGKLDMDYDRRMNENAQKITDHVRGNLTALKYFILYGVLFKKSVSQWYNTLRRKFGYDSMEYVDFEFWFMRFYNGDLDMDYDRSNDPQPRQLIQLPLELKNKIFSNLDPIELRIVRKVSKHFRGLIDTSDPRIEFISVETGSTRTTVCYNDHKIQYLLNFLDYLHPRTLVNISTQPLNINDGLCREVMDSDHSTLATNDLSIILKNPKLKLKKLHVTITGTDGDELKKMFEDLDRQVSTDEVEIQTKNTKGEFVVLPYLVPGTLKKVFVGIESPLFLVDDKNAFKQWMGRIGVSEQCRQADDVQLQSTDFLAEWFPMESFADCKNLMIRASPNSRNKLTINGVLALKEAILKSQLKRIHIESDTNFSLILFKRKLGKTALEVPDRPHIRHFRIPNTDEYYEMSFYDSEDRKLKMMFTRKSS